MPDSLDILICLVLPILTAVGGSAAVGLAAIEIAETIETGAPMDPVTLIVSAAVAICGIGYSVHMYRKLAD